MKNIDLKAITRIFIETDEKYLKISSIEYDGDEIIFGGDFNTTIYSSCFSNEEYIKVIGSCILRMPILDIMTNSLVRENLKFREVTVDLIYLPDSDNTISDGKEIEKFLKIDYDTLITDILDFSDINFHIKFLEVE